MSACHTPRRRRSKHNLSRSLAGLPGLLVWLLVWLIPIGVAGAQAEPQEPEVSVAPVDPPEAERAKVVDEVGSAQRQVEVVRAKFAPPGHHEIQEQRLWRRDGGRFDWARQGTQIAWDQAGEDGLYDVWISDPEGISERCLTCDNYDWRKANVFNPAWHPSGEILLVQVQDVARKLKMAPVPLATAHRGLHSEIWAFTADGKRYWQLTKFGLLGHAALDPRFSNEGNRLLWSERLTTKGGEWGRWAVGMADFEIKRGVPRIGKPQNFQPFSAASLVFANGFTPDDKGLLISAGTRPGASDLAVFKYQPEGGQLEQLSPRGRGIDSTATYDPRGQRIVWASSRNLDPPPWAPRLPWRNDLWRMDADGGRQERLTYFNDPNGDLYLGEALIDDLSWDPSGENLLVHVVSAGLGGGEEASEGIYLLRFDSDSRRP